MRLPKPAFQHPPEVHEAIIQEHQRDPVQMAQRLQFFGWPLADAAWAAVHWDLIWLAAAIANERQARRAPGPEASAPADPKPPRRTNRLPRTVRIPRTPRFPVQPVKPPEVPREKT